MTEASLITPELQALLGKEGEPEFFEVEKGQLKRLAQALGDPNPLWNDLDYARKSRYGNIIAPPTFLVNAGLIKLAVKLTDMMGPSRNWLDVGMEIEFFKPIEAGDTITSTAKLIDLKEKSGKKGPMLILLLEATYKNQRGEVVKKCRNTFISSESK